MRRAVVHINLDPGGALSVAELERAVARLRDHGVDVLASDLDRLPPTRREVDLLLDGEEREVLERQATAACDAALAPYGVRVTPRCVAVSFLSSGTEEDARAIVRAFGLVEQLRSLELPGEEVAVLVFERQALRGAASAKLQTALEAALNREVQFVER